MKCWINLNVYTDLKEFQMGFTIFHVNRGKNAETNAYINFQGYGETYWKYWCLLRFNSWNNLNNSETTKEVGLS